MSMVKIPYHSRSEQGRPLQECIARAAREMGVSEFFVAKTMAWFLQELEEQVGQNEVVRIPGFGMFAPWPWEPKAGKFYGSPYMFPVFNPSRTFINEVMLHCPLDYEHRKTVIRYRNRAHPSNTHRACRQTSRPWKVFAHFRDRMDNQARQYGLEDETVDS